MLTVPLSLLRGLMGSLQAPSSAGVLMLSWLRELLEGWEGVCTGGIGNDAGSLAPGGAPCHQSDHSLVDATHHAWHAEKEFLASGRGMGLKDLR